MAIVGQSGSGKSTCMNIIGCLDVPTAGTYQLNGRDVGKMKRSELAAIRNEMLGFVFQQYNLLPKLNLLGNVEVPMIYARVPRAQRHARAKAVLEQVGLGDKLKSKPNQLSGGQQAAGVHCAGFGAQSAPDPGGRAHRRSGYPYRPGSAGDASRS